jgi:hypothetical protein
VILSLPSLPAPPGVPVSTSGTVTAVVTVGSDPSDGAGFPTPTGAVTFTSDGRVACEGVELLGGRATCTMAVTRGTYVAAFYGGDRVYVGRATSTVVM